MINHGTKKRCSQDAGHYFPPCKRLRAEVDCAGKARHGRIDGVESPMSAIKCSPTIKSAIESGGTYRPSHWRRYRRPMIRFLSAHARTSKVDAVDAPFGIARDDVGLILRQCHAKVCARESSAGVVDLSGGDASLYFPSCTFQGWTPRYNDLLKNPPPPTEMDNTIVRGSPVKLEGERNRTLCCENLNQGEQIRTKNAEAKFEMETENYGDNKSTVALDTTNVPSSPPKGVKGAYDYPAGTPCRDLEPKSPAHGAPDSNLPFNGMPKPYDTPVVSRGSKRTTLSTSDDSVTLRRLPPYLRASPRLRTNASCSFTSFYSPLRPRTINGPMMAQYRSSAASPIRPRVSRGPSMVPYTSTISSRASPRPFVQEFATPLSNTFNTFNTMSGSDICFPRSGQATSTGSRPFVQESPSLHGVASIAKRILSYAAERLLVRIKGQGNEINTSPSPTNSCQPSSPPDTLQNSLRNKYRSSSSKLPIQCQLPFRPGSTRENEKSPIRNDCVVQGAEHRREAHLVKNPTTILPGPPKGWEVLFQPKAGEWKCKTCFYINPSEAMNCDSCTAFNDLYTECDATAKQDKDGVGVSIATRTSSILRNGKSQRHGTVSSGKRLKQGCAQMDRRYESLADDYLEEHDMDLG
jgi:hypothetical protein